MNKLFIKYNSTLKQTILKLNKSGSKTLVVVGLNNKLLGTISDGDVRKSIIQNQNIDRSIQNIYQKKPFYIKKEPKNISELRKIFLKNKFDLIPLVGNNQVVINIYQIENTYNDYLKKNTNFPLFILAGGEGTRMQPFTNILPKPLLPIDGQPIIQKIIENFQKFGVNKFYISVNYKKEILRAYFNQSLYKKQISYIQESKPLGTAGSLYLLKKNNIDNIVVSNCDVLFMINYDSLFDFHKNNKSDLTIVVCKKNYQIPYGTCHVNSKNKFTKLNEKPIINLLANTGLYILNKKVLNLVKKDTFLNMTDLIQLAKKKKLNISLYPISEDGSIEVGQWDQYKKNIDKFN